MIREAGFLSLVAWRAHLARGETGQCQLSRLQSVSGPRHTKLDGWLSGLRRAAMHGCAESNISGSPWKAGSPAPEVPGSALAVRSDSLPGKAPRFHRRSSWRSRPSADAEPLDAWLISSPFSRNDRLQRASSRLILGNLVAQATVLLLQSLHL